jgi:hypothetical protein
MMLPVVAKTNRFSRVSGPLVVLAGFGLWGSVAWLIYANDSRDRPAIVSLAAAILLGYLAIAVVLSVIGIAAMAVWWAVIALTSRWQTAHGTTKTIRRDRMVLQTLLQLVGFIVAFVLIVLAVAVIGGIVPDDFPGGTD